MDHYADNPDGLPKEVFEEIRAGVTTDRCHVRRARRPGRLAPTRGRGPDVHRLVTGSLLVAELFVALRS